MALWRWQHWPGHQFVTLCALFAGSSLFALMTSPIFHDDVSVKNVLLPLGNASIDRSLVTAGDKDKKFYRRLDGVAVTSQAEANRWPAGVMIENLLSVRPQSGLGDASVIYETLAESGVTRFLVVYDGPGHDVPRIGPVRSARHYYLEWISEYDGLYAHAGGSPQALEAISGLGIRAINGIAGGWEYFWRDPTIGAPHNLFTNSDHLGRALQQRGLLEQKPTYRSWKFKDNPPLKKRPVEDRVNPTIEFSSYSYQVHYEYDPDRNTYRRFNGGVEHVDRLNNEPLRASNIIVMRVPGETFLGAAGRISLNVTGEGEAGIFRDGTVIDGIWKKPNRSERTLFFDKKGKEIKLNRGQTWIEIVPGDREVRY